MDIKEDDHQRIKRKRKLHNLDLSLNRESGNICENGEN